jgi:hypothetical protein
MRPVDRDVEEHDIDLRLGRTDWRARRSERRSGRRRSVLGRHALVLSLPAVLPQSPAPAVRSPGTWTPCPRSGDGRPPRSGRWRLRGFTRRRPASGAATRASARPHRARFGGGRCRRRQRTVRRHRRPRRSLQDEPPDRDATARRGHRVEGARRPLQRTRAGLRVRGRPPATDRLDVANPAYTAWRSDSATALLALGQVDEARRLAGEEHDLARRWGSRGRSGSRCGHSGCVRQPDPRTPAP